MVKDIDGNAIFAILKMQEDRFKIKAGPNITPMQLFCYAIVHL